MIETILSNQVTQESFKIAGQLKRIDNLGFQYPSCFNDINSLNRESVVGIVQSSQHSYREKLLAIMFWGIFFEVVMKSGKLKFLHWINREGAEAEIERRFFEIEKSSDPADLFRRFDKSLKIPGLGYAYYTKIFFFVREASKKSAYPILDKWLMMAFIAVQGSENQSLELYEKYMKKSDENIFDGILRRKKSEAYMEYVSFLHSLASKHKLSVDEVETRLFGWDLRKNTSPTNPRVLYQKWALANGLNC